MNSGFAGINRSGSMKQVIVVTSIWTFSLDNPVRILTALLAGLSAGLPELSANRPKLFPYTGARGSVVG